MLSDCAGEDSWESLGQQGYQTVNPEENQPWIFIRRTDDEAEAPILWPPNAKSQLIRKDPDAEKDWWQEEKGMIKDEMVGWHHWLNGHESEQTQGDGEGQGSLVCCSPWGHKESDTTEQQQQQQGLTDYDGDFLYFCTKALLQVPIFKSLVQFDKCQ